MNGARHRFALGMTVFLMLCMTVLYPFLVYSPNAFVTKWRTLYIETAMSTMTHQWLATWFIPGSIIDDVMSQRYQMNENQRDATSVWDDDNSQKKDLSADTPENRFYAEFSELDRASCSDFFARNPEYLENGYSEIDVDLIESGGLGIQTTAGDDVLAINAKNGILIVGVTGDDYVGKLALVKRPENVFVGVCANLFDYGSFVSEMTSEYDAILGINASGFDDYEGNGTGGQPYGFLKSEGQTLQDAVGDDWKIIGIDEQDRLQIGAFEDTSDLRDAVEFQPALIINGKKLVEGSEGLGIQPRTSIGQAADYTMLMLVVDGRQAGYSLGCTVGECAEIMERYGAVQASQLDGGSSSVMVYNGREITRPTTLSKNAEGRTLPDAFLVHTEE